jgi:sugar lactone lactonase YvrE
MVLKIVFIFFLGLSSIFPACLLAQAGNCGQFIDMAQWSLSEYLGFDFFTGHLLKLNTRTWHYEVGTEDFGRFIHGLAFDEEKEVVYYLELLDGNLKEWDTRQGKITTLLSHLAGPAHVVLDDNRNLIISELLGGQLLQYSLLTGELRVLADNLNSPDVIALSPDNQYAWVTLFRPNGGLVRIDLATGQKDFQPASLHFPAGLALSQDGQTAFVTETLRGNLQRIDLRSGRVDKIRTAPLILPTFIALRPGEKTGWVVEAGPGRIVEVNLLSGKQTLELNLNCLAEPVTIAPRAQ